MLRGLRGSRETEHEQVNTSVKQHTEPNFGKHSHPQTRRVRGARFSLLCFSLISQNCGDIRKGQMIYKNWEGVKWNETSKQIKKKRREPLRGSERLPCAAEELEVEADV